MKAIFNSDRWQKVMAILNEHDFLDVSYGKDIPCDKLWAPLSLTLIPHTDKEVKFTVDALGKLELDDDSRVATLDEFARKKPLMREFGFFLHVF
jgi:hypothetical protein